MMDEFSAYVQVEIVHSKKPETTRKAFDRRWIKEGPGRPTKGIVNGNRREAEDSEIKEISGKTVLTIYPKYEDSPWNEGNNGSGLDVIKLIFSPGPVLIVFSD